MGNRFLCEKVFLKEEFFENNFFIRKKIVFIIRILDVKIFWCVFLIVSLE